MLCCKTKNGQSPHAPVMRFCLIPGYEGSFNSDSLLVPTSRHTGRHWGGLTPAAAVYSVILPSEMPMPPATKFGPNGLKNIYVIVSTILHPKQRSIQAAHAIDCTEG